MMARASRPPRAPRPKRSLTAQLAAIVLGFESIVVFLGGLAVYGLGSLPQNIPGWWGIVAGAVLALAMILTAGVVHKKAGIIVGWVLQGLVVLSGIVIPAMLIVALIFGGMWAYATIQGPRIEARGRSAAPEGV